MLKQDLIFTTRGYSQKLKCNVYMYDCVNAAAFVSYAAYVYACVYGSNKSRRAHTHPSL